MNYIGYGVVQGGADDLGRAADNIKQEMLRRMEQGWIPQGGISHVVIHEKGVAVHIYSQAVVMPKVRP